MEEWDGGRQGQQVGDEGLTLEDDVNMRCLSRMKSWYSGKRVVWDFQRNMVKFVGWEGGLGSEWFKGCTGSNCFLSRKGDTKLQESGLKSEKDYTTEGGMMEWHWESCPKSRVLWQGNNIFVLLLHPTVRWTAKWAFPRNAKERPEFWAELWRCWFCRL